MAGRGEGVPGDVEPGGAGEELVGEGMGLEEVDETLELNWVFGADIGGLTDEMLGIANTPYPAIDGLVTETRVDDDRPHHGPCGFQQLFATVDHISHSLCRRDVGRIVKISRIAWRYGIFFISLRQT